MLLDVGYVSFEWNFLFITKTSSCIQKLHKLLTDLLLYNVAHYWSKLDFYMRCGSFIECHTMLAIARCGFTMDQSLTFNPNLRNTHILAVIWTDLSIFRFQVVRLKLENSKRIVGTLIPNTAMTALLTALDEGSEGKEETIYWKPKSCRKNRKI